MTIRIFDGVADYLRFGQAVNLTGAFSAFVVVNRIVDAAWHSLFTVEDSAGTTVQWGLELGTDNRLTATTNTAVFNNASATLVTADSWAIAGVTKATGSAPVRLHLYKGGVWTHVDGGTGTNQASVTGGRLVVGQWKGTDDLNAHVSCVSVWQDTALTDIQVESLAGKTRFDWRDTPTSNAASWLVVLDQPNIGETGVPGVVDALVPIGTAGDETVRSGTTASGFSTADPPTTVFNLSSVGPTPISAIDSGTASDVSTIDRASSVAESATLSESSSITITTATTDSASVTESAGITLLGPIATGVLDDFNRADGVVNVGTGSTIWSATKFDSDTIPVSLTTSTNTLAGSSFSGSNGYTQATYGPDIDQIWTVATTGASYLGFWWNAVTAGNPAFVAPALIILNDTPIAGTDTWEIRTYNAGVLTLTTGTAPRLAAGHKIWISQRGATATVSHSTNGGSTWNQIAQTTLSSTYLVAGPFAVEIGNLTYRLDDFSGGTAFTPPVPKPASESFAVSDSSSVAKVLPVSDAATVTDSPASLTNAAIVVHTSAFSDVSNVTTNISAVDAGQALEDDLTISLITAVNEGTLNETSLITVVSTVVSKSLSAGYAVSAAAGKPVLLPYGVSGPTARSLIYSYFIDVAVGRSLVQPSKVFSPVGRSLAAPYGVQATVGKSLAQPYNITPVGTVSTSFVMPYLITVPLGRSSVQPYRVLFSVGRSNFTPYMVKGAVGQSLVQLYSVAQSTNIASKALILPYTVTTPISQSVAQPYTIETIVGRSIAFNVNVLSAVRNSLSQRYVIKTIVGRSLAQPYILQPTLFPIGASMTTPYVVKTAIGRSESLNYNVLTPVRNSLAQPYDVLRIVSRLLVQPYTTTGNASRSLELPYRMFNVTTGVSCEMPYKIIKLGHGILVVRTDDTIIVTRPVQSLIPA